jgi:ketosteroid isomerase-like protein
MSANSEKVVRLNTERARLLFRAVEHRDGPGVMAIYDRDIVINEAGSLPYGGQYRGQEGAIRHGQGFRAAWNRFQRESTRGLEPEFIAQGDRVVVLWRHKARSDSTGAHINAPAVGIYRFRDGKIFDSRMFHFDTAALLKFLSCNPSPGGHGNE